MSIKPYALSAAWNKSPASALGVYIFPPKRSKLDSFWVRFQSGGKGVLLTIYRVRILLGSLCLVLFFPQVHERRDYF